MKKMIGFVVLVVLLMTTASWAELSRFAAGLSVNSLYAIGGTPDTYCLGGQVKLGVTDNLDLEGRASFGESAGPGQVSGLGIYNIDIGNKLLVPYIGVGLSYLDLYTDITGLTRGNTYFGFIGILGINFFLGDRLPIFAEVLVGSFSGVGVSGVTAGINYSFK